MRGGSAGVSEPQPGMLPAMKAAGTPVYTPGRGLPIDFRQPFWSARLRLFLRDIEDVSYATLMDHLARLYGDRTAFVLDEGIDYPGLSGRSLGYRQVGDFAARIGAALEQMGVEPGRRVGLITLNRIEMAFCSFAVGRIGAIPVPMNFMLRRTEIAHVAEKAGIETIFCDRTVLDGTIRDVGAVPGVKNWIMVGDPHPPEPFVSLHDLVRDAPPPGPPVRPASNDETAVLFFTSGTTGLPKGAELSHDAVTVYFRHHGRFFSLLPRIPNHLGLLVMPVAHAGGYAVMMVQLIIGIPAFFLSRFDAGAILDTIEDHHPTIFSGTPAMFRMLVDSAGLDRDLGSVRIWSGGADAFSDGLISTFRGRWARRGLLGITRKPMFIRGYGMAETNTYLAQTPPFACGDNCLGWVLPPVQYRIVDPEGNDVRRGEQGELWVRGPNVAKRYWKDEGSTARAFTDGWFRTGDLVRQGRWRMLYFVGRSQEVIKTGGYKVSAVELDHVIGRHPDVEQVATVGVPDDVKGEVPVAAVVLRDGADTPEQEILEHAKRHLAPYKRPRRVIFLRAIPVTFNLKPRRLEVKGKILEHLGAEAGEERRGA